MEFRILGPLEVVGDDGTLNLGGPQQRRILAVLLSDPGRVLTYDRLVEVLWPEGDDHLNARRSAITYVSRLRSVLGSTAVRTTDAGYAIDPGGSTVDADRFSALLDHARSVPPNQAVETLHQALALWRGPVFGDLNDEWWARPLVKRLEELRLTALAERVDAMTAAGWESRALAEAQSLVGAHPLREQFVDRAMRCLHRAGQTAEALRHYQQYRTMLADQTGLDPSAGLIELERSMAAGLELSPTVAELAQPLRGYVLRDLLGEGSFGAVYRATQPGVDREVAVKVIRGDLADDRVFVRRFEVEAQLVARLEHPHIVPLYDFWRQPGGAFLVFRLLRGGNGDELIAREGPLSLERATAVLEQIGGALGAAHAAGVVHRDVKPSNVLFDDAGLAYLADFGIAAAEETPAEHVVAKQESASEQRWSAGSALYASPEQLRDGVEDARADQYALAATVWELLAGKAPFSGDNSSVVMRAKLQQPIPPLGDRRADIPMSVGAVLSRAGAVNPTDRFASVTEMIAAWHGALSTTTQTDPTSNGPRQRHDESDARARTMRGLYRPTGNPFKGLRPFREADAEDFHGRGVLVDRLAELTTTSALVAVVGPSGSGKSSLVLAGLVPRLRAAGRVVATLTPGEDPFGSLAAALQLLASSDQIDLVSSAALRRPNGIVEAMTAVGGVERLVVVIDQFEELWTLAGDDDRRQFNSAFAAALGAQSGQAVVTVRADFFDRPLADPDLGQLISRHTFGVAPMTADELHEAITAPAESLGVRFEPALAGRLVAESLDQPGALPLLQFALAELFERRAGSTILSSSYDELGGLAGSLSRQADEIYSSFGAEDRAATRRLFARLVTPGEGNEDTRRRVVRSDVPAVPEHVVDAFISRRLLTSDRDRSTRQPTVEVAHEVLLRSWPRLRSWLNEDRAWLRELRSLSGAARQWEAGGRDDADLYRGGRLAVASELAGAHAGSMTVGEQQFLEQSLSARDAGEREARQRFVDKVRQNRKLRRAIVGIGVVAVAALTAGSIAVLQGRRANEQERRAVAQRSEADRQRTLAQTEQAAAQVAADQAARSASEAKLTTLASRSLSLRSSQRDLAALLAVEAYKRRPDATSKSALFGTFTFDPGFLGYVGIPGASNANGVAVPGTSNVLVAGFPLDRGSVYGPVHLVDISTGEPGVQLDPLQTDGNTDLGLAVSGDGHRAAVIGTRTAAGPSAGVVGVFDLATGHRVGPLVEVPLYHRSLALNQDGSILAVNSGDKGEGLVFDVATGAQIGAVPGAPDAPPEGPYADTAAFAFGPDGRLYVGSLGTHLRVFDPRTMTLLDDISVPLYATAGLMRFGADGHTIYARGVWYDLSHGGEQHGSMARIDLLSRRAVWQIGGSDYAYGECASFAVSEATDRLWCGNYFGLIRERSLTTGQLTGHVLVNQKGWISNLALMPLRNGPLLVGFGSNSGFISRWYVDGGGAVSRHVAGGRRIFGELADGHTLLVGTPTSAPPPFDFDFTLWDATSDTEIPGLPKFIFAGTTGMLVVGAFADGTTGHYDIVAHERVSSPIGLVPTPSAAAGTTDDKYVALGYSDGHVEIHDTATGHEVQRFTVVQPSGRTISVSEIAFGIDGRIYIAGHGVWSFDVATGRKLAENDDGNLGSVTAGPSGLVVAGSLDGALSVLDADTLAKVGSLPGARGFVQDIRISDDGTTLLGRANDGTVSIYDLPSRLRLGDAIDNGQEPITGRGFASLRGDGREAGTTGPDGSGVVLWDLDPEHWASAACTVAGRNLTRDEWTTYLGDLGSYAATCPQFPPAA